MADESPGKALWADFQAKQQAADEAKAALDAYKADKAAAAAAAADEDAPMPDAPEASGDEDDDELARAVRNVAQRRDSDATPLGSRAATPAPEAFAAPGAGWARSARRPSVAKQLERLRLDLGADESGIFPEEYWAKRYRLQLDGRTPRAPLKTWKHSYARHAMLELRERALEALSAVVLSRDVCKCGTRVVDGDEALLEGAWRCDALQCQAARCAKCLEKEPMGRGQKCGNCSPLVIGPEDAELPQPDIVPGLFRSWDVPEDMLAALEAVIKENTRDNREELMRAWDAGMRWFKAPEGVTFKGNAGRMHATILLKRLKSWKKVGRRLGDWQRGATHHRVLWFAGKYFGGATVRELEDLNFECERLCVAPRPNPGEGNCESCADVTEFVATVISDAEDELKAALERKGVKKRGRAPSTDEIVEETTELLRMAADKELAAAYGDDSKKYKRGKGPLDKDHVKY
jgi:hypothetical protein